MVRRVPRTLGRMWGSARARTRWVAVPWSEATLAITLVAAAAAPSFLVAASGVWRSAAADDVAARAVESAPLDRNGLDVQLEVAFDPGDTPAADLAMRAAVESLPELEPLDLTLYTLPGLLTIGPPARQVGPAGRLFAHDGALDALEIVEQLPDTSGGVFVSDWFAERHDLQLGDGIGFEAGAIADEAWNDLVQGGGEAAVFRIVGIYEALWSPATTFEPDPYWASMPGEVVPTFVHAFNGPNNELVVAERSTVERSGLTGVARWRAPLRSIPATHDGLLDLRRRFRDFESALVEPGSTSEALSATSTAADGRPRLTTDLFDTAGEVDVAVRRLDRPLASSRAVGAVAGLVAMFAVGWFFVERRRSEFRLLAAEGAGAIRLSGLVAVLLLPPVAVGAAAGVVSAVLGLWLLGPADGPGWSAVPVGGVIAVSAVGWAVAAVVAGRSGARSLRSASAPGTLVGSAAVTVLAAATGFAWVQVGRTSATSGTDVDLVVVMLPIVAVLLAVVVVLGVAGAVATRLGRGGGSRSVPLFLAGRRLAVGSTGMRGVAGAIGLGVGLVVFAVALTATLDRTVDVKLATEIGGETTLRLTDEPGPDADLPDPTTLARTFDTVVTPGDGRMRVIAVDPTTWIGAVTWPEAFGSDPETVLDLLATELDDAVPAVGIVGERTPPSGAFGLTRTYAFQIVGRVASLPGAGSNDATILISKPALDRLAAEEEGYASVREAAADGFVFPTVRFTRRLISGAPADELVDAVEDAGLRYRDVVSLQERRRDAGILAARAALGYLAVLGIVAAVAALVALGLFLAARRRARALGSVMARSMGLSAARAALVTTIEVAAVLIVALVAAFAAVPLVVRRLAARFDPAPTLPPEADVRIAWSWLLPIAVVAVASVAGAVWWMEWRGGRRPAAEVIRDS